MPISAQLVLTRTPCWSLLEGIECQISHRITQQVSSGMGTIQLSGQKVGFESLRVQGQPASLLPPQLLRHLPRVSMGTPWHATPPQHLPGISHAPLCMCSGSSSFRVSRQSCSYMSDASCGSRPLGSHNLREAS